MIKIEMDRDDTNGRFSVSMSGHAGYAPSGSDIICSACTMAANTLALWACEKHLNGLMVEEPEIRLEPGDIYISFTPKAEAMEQAKEVFHFVMIGFWKLARDYSQYVQFTLFGEDESS